MYTGHKNIAVCYTIKFLERQWNMATENDKNEETGPKFLLTPCDQNMAGESRLTDSESTAPEQVILPGEEIEDYQLPRRSERSTKGMPPQRFGYSVGVDRMPEPTSIKEIKGMNGPKKYYWLKAANEDMTNIKKNKTWELVDVPSKKKVTRCR